MSYDIGTALGTATNVGRCNAGGTAAGQTTGFISGGHIYFKVQKRATPTITAYDGAGNSGKCSRFTLGGPDTNNSSLSIADQATNGWFPYSSGSSNDSGLGVHWVASSELQEIICIN